MVFELISWIYISFICFVWGDCFVRVIFRDRANTYEFGFPAICFLGMAVIGTVALYASLFIPLKGGAKIFLQAPVFLYFLNRSNRFSFLSQIRTLRPKLSYIDFLFLIACIVMILFLSTSPIIHPDSLNYHIYSIQVFNQYGMIPGIANLQLELGLQSLWFAVMSVFDLSFFQPSLSYPLSGCVLCWFIIFVISRSVPDGVKPSVLREDIRRVWYLLLLIFSILSWTQIRLTVSSASPDFIVTICVLFSFYFFLREPLPGTTDYSFYLAVFFSMIAISIKLSAISIVLIPAYIFVYWIIKKRFLFFRNGVLLSALLLLPVVIRNLVSTGYPLYPSSFANVFHADWKLDEFKLIQFQHYITTYARYPIIKANLATEYATSFQIWLPIWWRHLYISDKIIMLLIASGVLSNLFSPQKWLKTLSAREKWGFIVSFSGAIIWFINAPDPRFGTGFLLPLIYFLYTPLLLSVKSSSYNGWILNSMVAGKFITAMLVVVYILYRSIYFFHPEQLVFPDGIKQVTAVQADCHESIKRMLFLDSFSLTQVPDSCRTSLFRGTSIAAGFRPVD